MCLSGQLRNPPSKLKRRGVNEEECVVMEGKNAAQGFLGVEYPSDKGSSVGEFGGI